MLISPVIVAATIGLCMVCCAIPADSSRSLEPEVSREVGGRTWPNERQIAWDPPPGPKVPNLELWKLDDFINYCEMIRAKPAAYIVGAGDCELQFASAEDEKRLLDLYKADFGVDLRLKDAHGYVADPPPFSAISFKEAVLLCRYIDQVSKDSMLGRALARAKNLWPKDERFIWLRYYYRPFVSSNHRRTEGVVVRAKVAGRGQAVAPNGQESVVYVRDPGREHLVSALAASASAQTPSRLFREPWACIALIDRAAVSPAIEARIGKALAGYEATYFDPVEFIHAGMRNPDQVSEICVRPRNLLAALRRIKRRCGFPIRGVKLIDYEEARRASLPRASGGSF